MKCKFIAIAIFFTLLVTACSVPKDVTYFQGVDNLTTEQLEQMSQTYSTKICPDDLLTITVTGWDPTVLTPFNPPVYSFVAEGDFEMAYKIISETNSLPAHP